MESLASGAFKHRLQTALCQTLAQILGRQFQGIKGHFRRGIKIEDHSVRRVDRVNSRAPGMNFDSAHLNKFEQALLVVYVKIFETFSLVRELERVQMGSQVLCWMGWMTLV